MLVCKITFLLLLENAIQYAGETTRAGIQAGVPGQGGVLRCQEVRGGACADSNLLQSPLSSPCVLSL